MYISFYQNWIKIGWVMSTILYAHIWAYAPNMIDFGPLIGQISIFLNETNFIWKVSLNYTLSMNISPIPTLLWILWSNNRKNWPKLPLSQFAIFKQLTSFKIIGLNRVSKIWGPNSEICRAFFRIWPPNFFKGLSQHSIPNLRSKFNSTLMLKISWKNIETLLWLVFYYFWTKPIVWILQFLSIFAIIWPQNPQLSRYWADIHRQYVV